MVYNFKCWQYLFVSTRMKSIIHNQIKKIDRTSNKTTLLQHYQLIYRLVQSFWDILTRTMFQLLIFCRTRLWLHHVQQTYTCGIFFSYQLTVSNKFQIKYIRKRDSRDESSKIKLVIQSRLWNELVEFSGLLDSVHLGS